MAVGVPLMVMVLLDQVAFTPEGKLLTVPIPVAPVVVCVILVDKAVFTHVVRSELELNVLVALTMILPVALTVPQPPVKGTP